MKRNRWMAAMTVLGVILLGTIGMAQDPEPPLTWKGKGQATLISEEGTRDIEFDLRIHVGEDGIVSGEVSTEDGNAQLERLYYGEKVKFDFPGLESRRLVLVLSLRDSDNPSVIIMNGQALADRFGYGELRARRLSAEGLKEALDLGNKEPTLLEEGALPEGVRKALEESAPMGCFKMTGGFVDEK